jgi:hypothetical protein
MVAIIVAGELILVAEIRFSLLNPLPHNEVVFKWSIREMNYLGARENGPPVQDQEAITLPAWRGIVGMIQGGLANALFAEDFPDRSCADFAEAITGCSRDQFYLRLTGEHPEIPVPLDPNNVPETLPALEVVEFCFRHVSMPVAPDPHDYFFHRHYLHFQRGMGQEEFARDVNSILARNHLAYELQLDGQMRRLLPPVLREALASAQFTSEDQELNRLLESARNRFGSPDFHTRYDALRDLWHGFERLKTLEPPRNDIRQSSEALIARVSPEPQVRAMLRTEMRVELNDFGNGFFIRHADVDQVLLQTTEEIDYLFHRLFALIRLLLRRTGRGQ